MKISLQWIKQILPGVRATSQALAQKLSVSGLEVEALFDDGSYLQGDTILELAIPPNRGDCLSHVGVAREIAALYHLSFKEFPSQKIKGSFSVKQKLSVKVKESSGCLRYCSRMIQGVKIGPSPLWLTRRLENLGIRPVNNVVDATNYVMLETGHPLHAFDYRFVRGKNLIIRKAGVAQKFETLDHQVQDLIPSDLVIADSQGPVALAGILGGKESEIKEDSDTLVLEAASFDPVRIRQTAKRLGIHTESSHRFERGVDPSSVAVALDRLTLLILQLAGGEVSFDQIDIYPRKKSPFKITLRKERLRQIMGYPLKNSEVGALLKSLGFKISSVKSGWKVMIPTYREDISREIDLIEEIVRLTGFEKVRSELPKAIKKPIVESAMSRHEDQIRNFMSHSGFSETIHYSFCSVEELTRTGFSSSIIQLQNPLSQDLSVMRPTLLTGLLKASYLRQSEGEGIRLYELRSVYQPPHQEQKRLSGIYGGSLLPKQWNGLNKKMDFSYGKGILNRLFEEARLLEIQWNPTSAIPQFHPAQALEIKLEGESLGYFGKLHPSLLQAFGLQDSFYYFDLDYSLLAEKWGKVSYVFRDLSPYPSVSRDMALLVDRQVTYQDILKAIDEAKVSYLKKISLFDLYEGEKIPPGKKSLAFSLTYENQQKTLTDEEVNQVHFALVERLKKQLGGALREA